MKKTPYFLSGIVLCGFGIYFLLQQLKFSLLSDLYSWPTLFIIIGIAFLFHGYAGKEYSFILPGVFITGVGIHFHIAQQLQTTFDVAGIFLLLLGLGLLLSYIKTGYGLFQGILFLSSSLLLLFLDKLKQWLLQDGHSILWVEKSWPYLFILLGLYFLLRRKRK